MTPRSRSATSRCSVTCRSERTLQHRQPLPSSAMLSLDERSSASSMPVSPNSLTMTAVPAPCGVARKRRTSVVFPAPRKPVTTVTGIRAPRSRFARRPNGPAVEEGKSSSIGAALRVTRGVRATQSSSWPGLSRPPRSIWHGAIAMAQTNVKTPCSDNRGHRDKPGDDACAGLLRSARLRNPSRECRGRRRSGRRCRRSCARRRSSR